MFTVQRRRRQTIRYPEGQVVSSAQNREDVLLNRVFLGKSSGFYVDLGAGDPNADSVTRWFYDLGWTGINVEPNPDIFRTLDQWRPKDINLNVGVGARRGRLTYHQVIQNEVGHGWGLSGFSSEIPARARAAGFAVRRQLVDVVPLTDIALHCGGREVDFLKIDVEGHEAEVLRSADWSRFRPKVICIEGVEPMSARPSFTAWERALHGYRFALFDGVNDYYVRKESLGLLPQFNAAVNCNDRWVRA